MISGHRSPVGRARRAAIAAAALSVGALVAAGCGSSTTSGAGVSSLASYVPVNAPLYFEVSTEVDGTQWKQAIALAKVFPGYPKLAAEFNKALADEKLDFAKDIKPALGTSAVLAITNVDSLSDNKGDPPVVVAIDIVDGQEALATKLLTDSGGVADGDYKGYSLYKDKDATGDEFGAAAIGEGTLVMADDNAALKKTIDVHAGGRDGTLASSKKVSEAFAELPDAVLAQGYLDVGALARLGAAGSGVADKETAEKLAKSGIGPDSAAGISVSAEAEGLRMKAVAINLGKAATQGTEFTPTLLDNVPADALGYVGLNDLYGTGSNLLTQFGADDPEIKKGLDQARGALALIGLSSEDLKFLTSGEHAIVVTKGDKTPGAVLALEVADSAKAMTILDTVRKGALSFAGDKAKDIPPFTEVELANGAKGQQSAIDPEAGIVYGADGKLAFIGTRVDAIKQVQAPTTKLKDDPDFQAATRQMPAKIGGLFWLNGSEIIRAVERAGGFKGAPAEVVPNLKPIKNLAAWSTGGERPTFEAFLTIK